MIMNFLDQCIITFDQGLRILTNTGLTAHRKPPTETTQALQEAQDQIQNHQEEHNTDYFLTDEERKKISAYMRINHAGEIAAQGLYHGQILAARDQALIQQLEQAAQEEIDHLLWCKARLNALNSRPSWFDPLWYYICFKLGLLTGLINNQLSLGLIAAVEQQVYRHLQEHIDDIPATDQQTHAILKQMQQDELKHRNDALASGGIKFPQPLEQAMFLASRIMTKVSYYL